MELVEKVIALSQIGAAASCPYCIGTLFRCPDIGDRIVFLGNFDAGQRATVIKDNFGTCPKNCFLVRMDNERNKCNSRMVARDRDLFISVDRFKVPHWMAPLSIEDHGVLHHALIQSTLNLTEKQIRIGSLDSLIGACWWHRFPLSGQEVWPIVHAHGTSKKLQQQFIYQFDFGMSLLVNTQGRQPIKRKKVRPLSIGRYVPKSAALN